MLTGWTASLLVRHDMHPSDWGMLFIIGVAGCRGRAAAAGGEASTCGRRLIGEAG